MASFVEQATLILVDKASKPANKINRALQRLFATADKLDGKEIRIKTNDLNKAAARVNRLKNNLNELTNRRTNIRVTADTRAAEAALNRLARSRRVNLLAGMTGGDGIGRSIGKDIGLGFRASLGAEFFQFIRRSAVRGATSTDVADTRLALQQLPPGQEAFVRQAVQDVIAQQRRTPSGQMLNEAQTQSLMVEALGVTKQDVRAAEFLTAQLTEMIKLGRSQGQSVDEALEGAINFAKAGEQMNYFSDAAGNFDPKGATEWFNLMRKAAPTIGKEFVGSFVRQATSGLRGSKGAISAEEFLKLLIVQEETSSAAVGYNQAIKNLAGGRATKRALKNMEKFGLITTEQAKAGEVGGLSLTELVGSGAVDEAELRANMSQWVSKYAIPAMVKAGFDPNNPVDVSRFAGLIASDRTAEEAITTLINRDKDLTKAAQQALRRDGSVRASEEAMRGSSLIRATNFSAQVENVIGNAVRALEPALLPVMDSINNQLADMAQGKVTPSGLAALGLTGATASAAATPFATVAGLEALIAGDANQKVLGAIAINTGNTAAGVAALAASQALGNVADAGGGFKNNWRRNGLLYALFDSATTPATQPLTQEQETAKQQAITNDILKEIVKRDDRAREGDKKLGIDRDLFPSRSFLMDAAGDIQGFGAKAAKIEAATDAVFDAQGNLLSTYEFATDKLSDAVSAFAIHADMFRREFPKIGLSDSDRAKAESASRGTDQIKALQGAIGAKVDGVFGDQTKQLFDEYKMQRAAYSQASEQMRQTTVQSLLAMQAPVTKIEQVFNTGSAEIAVAGQQASTSIATGMTTGGQQAADLIRAAHSAGAAQVAAAIANATARVNVNVNSGTSSSGFGGNTGGMNELMP